MMSLQILQLGHVNVTVPTALEEAARHFYAVVMGLPQVPKPSGPRQNLGAWYQLGQTQLHLSLEDEVQNNKSDRHVCYLVADISRAEDHFRNAGTEIIADNDRESRRFFVRDPGGNLLEIAEQSRRS